METVFSLQRRFPAASASQLKVKMVIKNVFDVKCLSLCMMLSLADSLLGLKSIISKSEPREARRGDRALTSTNCRALNT